MADLPVLVVEGDLQLRSFIRVALSKADFRVLEAVDGTDALSKLRDLEGKVGVLVSSYFLPQMDGSMLARHVKVQFPSVRILLLCWEENACQCHDCDAVLAKPFAPQDLVATVRRLTRSKQEDAAGCK